MFVFGPISTIFDLVIFAILFFGLGYNTKQMQPLFNAGWFIFSAITQALIVCILRSKKISFIQTRPSTIILMLSLLLIIICASLPFMPIVNQSLKFIFDKTNIMVLNPIFFAYAFGATFGYILLTEVSKKIYLKFSKEKWL